MFITKTNGRYKPQTTKTKVDPMFSIWYINVRGPRSNFPDVEHYFHGVKPNLMFLSETGLNFFITVWDFRIKGYST